MPKHLIYALLLLAILAAPARAATPFRFEDYLTLDQMRVYIEKSFPLGAARDDLRHAFVEQGKARLVEHPRLSGVEKYLYDINLCDRYIFRWNISADYNGDGKLEQAYVNGRFVYMAGKQPRTLQPQDVAPHSKSRRFERLRPEAVKGRKSLRFSVYDIDGNFETTDDQMAQGDGILAAAPSALTQWLEYTNVEPWRSIFDMDEAPITPFSPCTKASNMIRDPDVEKLLMPELDRLKREMDALVPPPALAPAPTPVVPKP